MNRKTEFEKVRAAYEKAVQERDKAAADVEAAKTEIEPELADLAARLGLGELSADQYETGKAKALGRSEKAQEALERSEAVVASLGSRAADLAEQEAEEKVADAEGTVAALDADEDDLVARLANVRELREQADEALAFARHEAAGARAPFDPEAASRMADQDRSDGEVIRWHVRHAATAPETWPLHLRARIAEAVERRKVENVEERERLHAEGHQSLIAAGFVDPPFERVRS